MNENDLKIITYMVENNDIKGLTTFIENEKAMAENKGYSKGLEIARKLICS